MSFDNDSMYLCECGGKFCGQFIPTSTYHGLSSKQDENDYIVYKDHVAADEKEIQREGDWVLVRAERGD